MLLSPTVQLTVYLYWEHYPEMCRMKGAIDIAQELYLGKHRNIFQLFEKYIMISRNQKIKQEQNKGEKVLFT